MKNKHLNEPTVSEDLTDSENQSSEEKVEDRDETNNPKTHQLTLNNGLEEHTTKPNLYSNDISEEENKLMCSPQKKKIESTFSLEELTSDDEIYTFGYPENFLIEGLLDNKIFLDYVYKITDNESDDIFKLQVLDSESSFLTLALPSQKLGGCLVNLPLKGKILIQEGKEMPLKYESARDDESKSKINFFENVTVRHPLIGVDWKNHITLAETIIKNKSLKRKRKKIKIEVEEESEVLNDEISPRKKKKRKYLDTQD